MIKSIVDFLSWWCWRRFNIYVPNCMPPRESRKSVVVRLNRGSWPCSDKALFFPSMEIADDESKATE